MPERSRRIKARAATQNSWLAALLSVSTSWLTSFRARKPFAINLAPCYSPVICFLADVVESVYVARLQALSCLQVRYPWTRAESVHGDSIIVSRRDATDKGLFTDWVELLSILPSVRRSIRRRFFFGGTWGSWSGYRACIRGEG